MNDFDSVLSEIEEIIAKIGNFQLTESERADFVKLFKAKIRQAKYISSKNPLKMVS